MLYLYLEIPFASWRKHDAREYAQSYDVPPPATIYGALLSTIGEMDREKYGDARLTVAIKSKPKKSTILRKVWRFKKAEFDHPSNCRPDYYECCSNTELVVGIDHPQLERRIKDGLERPEEISRFGCVSLGESRDIINDIRIVPEIPAGWFRYAEADRGKLRLPIWTPAPGDWRGKPKMGRFELIELNPA